MPYTDSDPDTDGLQLEGLWLHDPDDAEDTIVQYRFGRASRGTSIGTMPEGITLAGREFPIFDFGEHTSQVYSIKIDMPESETTQADLQTLIDFANTKKTLYLRDNRGRAAYGIIDGFSIGDTEWGSEVSFSFITSDYTVEEVV